VDASERGWNGFGIVQAPNQAATGKRRADCSCPAAGGIVLMPTVIRGDLRRGRV